MNLKGNILRTVLVIVFATAVVAASYALSSYLNTFKSTYPSATYPNAGTYTCLLCHTGYPASSPSINNLNAYGTDYMNNGYSFSAIESLDSDGDGYTNIAEIRAGSFPGDASSHPSTTYTVGGSVSGLSGTVVLQNNGADNLSRSANGSFTFATALASGAAYNVTVLTQPAGQTCSVANGSGTISGANIANVSISCQVQTACSSLSVSGAASCQTSGVSGTTQVGYAKLTVNSGATPYGIAVFSLTQNGVTVTEAGVPASPPTTAARTFIDYRKGVSPVPGQSDAGTVNINTGIAIVNDGSAVATVTYTLRDPNGVTLSIGHGTVAAGTHFAKFIDQIKDVAPDFNLPANFQSTSGFGSLEITSDQPLSVLALRGTNTQRNDFLITTTPTADLTQPLTYSGVYFPQFADGGGYSTSLVLLNTSNMTESGILRILDDNGAPLVVNQVGGTGDSAFRYSIPSGGVFHLQTDGSPAAINVGWVQLIPDASTPTPIASGMFSNNPGSLLVSESGIPAAVSTTHARVYVDLSGNHDTGIAIANVNSTPAVIQINAFQNDGVTSIGTTQGPLQLAGDGHASQFADAFISGLPAGFTGVLDISSTMPFAVLTVRSLVNEREDFLMTTFPVADANQPAPSPIVFPQIADGGGYQTEFILISVGQPAGTTLNYYDDNGAPTIY
jgi:hypothetical protein